MDAEQIKRAASAALDARKHEIDLFWTRSLFFWGFISVAAAAYGFLASAAPATDRPLETRGAILRLSVVSFGLVCSIAWTLVNRGSKFWQDSWEKNVGSFEDHYFGGTFFTKPRRDVKVALTTGGEFSVTRVTIILSYFVAFLWSALWISEVNDALKIIATSCISSLLPPVIILGTCLAVFCLFYLGRRNLEGWDGPSLPKDSP